MRDRSSTLNGLWSYTSMYNGSPQYEKTTTETGPAGAPQTWYMWYVNQPSLASSYDLRYYVTNYTATSSLGLYYLRCNIQTTDVLSCDDQWGLSSGETGSYTTINSCPLWDCDSIDASCAGIGMVVIIILILI